MNPYEVIEAETPEEALVRSNWKAGDLATCKEVRAANNNDGTWSLFPVFEKAILTQIVMCTNRSGSDSEVPILK